MRVTAQMQANNAIAYMEQANSTLTTYENQVSSGVQLEVPSDNPVGYTTLSQDQTSLLHYATYNDNITSATATLNNSASALQNVNNVLTQAQTLATQGADATTTSTGYQALAIQVGGLIKELLSNANAQVGGNYLFSGAASATQPFQVMATDSNGNPTAITYNGSSQASQALIGPNQTVNTQYAGNQVFQQSGADVFQALITLQQNLTNPTLTQSQGSMSQALNQSLTQISSAATAVQNVEAEQSTSVTTMGSLQTQLQSLQNAASSQAGNISSTDYSTAIVQLQEQQTLLQASMTVSSKLLQQSLVNLLQ